MRDKPDAQPVPASTAPLEGRLDSWKEIAAYLGRGIRTVQRWEREEGLPVHRLAHDKRSSIYARKEELAAWWESRRRTLANPASTDPADNQTSLRLERVTRTAGTTNWPALSSDARLLAYVSDGGQDDVTPQIWTQQIGGAAIRLTSGEREYSNLSFSPDDTRIVFTASDAAGQHVYEVPTLGGEPRLLKRSVASARYSPSGEWLAYVPLDASGIRISADAGAGFRTIGTELVDVSCLTWLPDGRFLICQARPNPVREPEWWLVAVDAGSVSEIGINRVLRERGVFPTAGSSAWIDDSLVFAAVTPTGVSLYRQRLVTSPLQLVGAAERLTMGNESSTLPAAAAGRVAFVSSGVASNLWSLPIDADGATQGSPRRLTRNPAPILFLSITRDFRTLAYFSARLGDGDVVVRDLASGSEKATVPGPPGGKGYPAISPSGRQLAFGTRILEQRPIFIADLHEGSYRRLGEDCGGRPRQWVDERVLVMERFARLNSIAVIDTTSAEQRDVLVSATHSIRNPRLSPDGDWIAFDATRPGEPSALFVARFRQTPIPESEWHIVDRLASHPFWAADGRLLYYVPTGANPMIRSSVRARRFVVESGLADGEPIAVFSSTEMMMPAFLPGTAPIAAPDQIIFVLGDFRGDVWLMDRS